LEYRFEHHSHIHFISFGEMVPYTGFNVREEAEIKGQASMIAKPLKRLQEIIDAKRMQASISVQ
jgi:hypothetical protein